MNRTGTLESVIATVHQKSEHYFDEVIPVQDMEFDNFNQMWISGRRVEILPSAQHLIANRLRVPHSYLCRCPQELQAENLNYWIREEAKNRQTFFCRFDDHKLRAVFTDRYRPLDNMEILSQMIENKFDPSAEVQYSIDDTMFLVKIPEYARAFRVRTGYEGRDDIVPGISFANSEVGILAFSIEAFFYRIICTNGLISQASSTSRFKHISTRGLENFHDTLAHVIQNSIHNQNQFQISQNTHVNNPIASIEKFSQQFGLSMAETEVVRQSYYKEEGCTMFHIINAFTAAGKTPGLTTSEVYKYEKTGGLILSLVKA
jgi:Domain of unknown function (DUF932).